MADPRELRVQWSVIDGRATAWSVNGRACTAEEGLSILLHTCRAQAKYYLAALKTIAESPRDSSARRLAREALALEGSHDAR